MEFLLQEKQRPSKNDYYLMQIAMEVKRVLSSNPEKIKLEDFRLAFDVKEDPEQKRKRQRQKMERSKSAWLGSLGITKKGSK